MAYGTDRFPRPDDCQHLISTRTHYMLIFFNDSVLNENPPLVIDGAHRQSSNNAGRVIRGIGVVSYIYANPETDQFWTVDYRIYDPDPETKARGTLSNTSVTTADSARREAER